MRKSILLPLLVVGCSGDAEHAGYRVVPRFVDRSASVRCEPVDVGAAAVDVLRTVTDSTVLVLDAAARRVTELGDDLRPRWTLEYAEHGPGAVARPVAATLVGDTVAVVVRDGLRLVLLTRSGRPLHEQPLEFVPNAIAASGDELLITPMPLGAVPPSLLFRFHDGRLDEVPVPRRPYADMMVGAMGNATLVESLADGSALVVHQLLRPRAFRVSADRAVVAPLTVPTPDGTIALADAVPRAPITEEQFDRLLVPAMALSVDRARGEAYLLTRSGRTVDGRRERAILRTDDRLRYLASYLLDVNAVHMAVLPRRGAALVADDADRFFLCPIDGGAVAE